MDKSVSESFDIGKAILLAGVIMIHCNPSKFDGTPENVKLLFTHINYYLNFCVPFFFILSGYLFFANLSHLNLDIYKQKMSSRFHTLLIPYLLWCTIAGIFICLKVKFLGHPGNGIFIDNRFSIIGFIRGFWNAGDNFPFDFPLWFLRNLIIFQLLTPIIYMLSRIKWLSAIILLLPLFDIDLYGFEYFFFGSYIGIYKHNLKMIRKHIFFISTCFLVLIFLCTHIELYIFPLLVYSGIYIFIPFCIKFRKIFPTLSNDILNHKNAFFFIYAIHGLYAFTINKTYFYLFGTGTIISSLTCFFLSFISNILISYCIFLIMKRCCNKLLNILCGMRASAGGEGAVSAQNG